MRRAPLDVRGGSADVRGAQVPLAAVRLSINFNLNLRDKEIVLLDLSSVLLRLHLRKELEEV